MSEGRVLIVDDDRDILALLGRKLERAGFETMTAEDANQAVKNFFDVRPDAVVLDLFMPKHHGSELLKDFRRMDGNVPVIIVTADSRVSSAVEMIKLGAYDYLVKPDYGHIAEIVSAAIRIRENQQLARNNTERLSRRPKAVEEAESLQEPPHPETVEALKRRKVPQEKPARDTVPLRRFTRIPFSTDVLINGSVSVRSVDLSEGGIYLVTGRTYAPGTELKLEFMVQGKPVIARARVKQYEETLGVGCEFLELGEREAGLIRSLVKETLQDRHEKVTRKRWVVFLSETMNSLRMYKSQLLLDGFSIIEADSPRALFSNLLNYEISAVVVDMDSLETDPIDLIHKLKETTELMGRPLLAFSTSNRQALINQAASAGADAFVSRMTTTPKKMSSILENYTSR